MFCKLIPEAKRPLICMPEATPLWLLDNPDFVVRFEKQFNQKAGEAEIIVGLEDCAKKVVSALLPEFRSQEEQIQSILHSMCKHSHHRLDYEGHSITKMGPYFVVVPTAHLGLDPKQN